MTVARSLQPTLWRTCRVLANRTRLQMLGLLLRRPNQTVSAVALQLKVSLPVASQYLRALEARGLLTVGRVGRRVKYRISAAPSGEAPQELIETLRQAFQRDSAPVETLFKLATAFTQPRRIEIVRALKQEPQSRGQLKAVTGMSARALARHLRKLEARGFVVCRRGMYSVTARPEGFGRALAWLATGGRVR
jgi:DNA-binding transcriptional ArsR family regulator